jgi:PhnB protein
MDNKPNPIPEGYSTITPYFIVRNAALFIDFLKNAFDAQERYRMPGPNGEIMHAEFMIGDSIIMMGEAGGEWQPTSNSLYLYVPDVDATYQSALNAGATSIQKVSNQFYGDRSGGVRDPFGNTWFISTHVEDVSQEEMEKRMAQHNQAST